MKSLLFALPFALAIPMTAMAADESFPISDATWSLTELNGAAYDGKATIAFPEEGAIAGKAPCNNFMGSLDGTPEAFTLGPLAATQMMCPDMEAETAFFGLLSSMTMAEISDETVTLGNADGAQMVFSRDAE